jgi:hypothetical protein
MKVFKILSLGSFEMYTAWSELILAVYNFEPAVSLLPLACYFLSSMRSTFLGLTNE